MRQEFIDKKALYMRDEEIYSCISESIFNGLRMLTLTAKPEHARIVFDGILPIIRNRFNDFTMNQLDSAIKSGSYGEYGEYTKFNPKTLMDWFSKKRLDISNHNEKYNKDEKRVKENQVIPCKNGGTAVLLGLFYDSKGYSMDFQDRLKLIESGKVCPFTNQKISDILRTFQIEFKLERR